MERDSLLRFYDECKIYVKKILDAIESCDTSILRNIQILTQNKKSFILESHIEGFWNDFKQDIDVKNIRDRISEMNSLRNQEAKMYEAFICYLMQIFIDEFKIDEYNLGSIFKQHHKKVESHLKNLKKSQSLDQTIEMNQSLVIKKYLNQNEVAIKIKIEGNFILLINIFSFIIIFFWKFIIHK